MHLALMQMIVLPSRPYRHQPFRLFLLEALLKVIKDPDASMCDDLRNGVRLGVQHALPPSRHWPTRSSAPTDSELHLCEGTWKSAADAPDQVRALLQEELEEGWISVHPSLESIQASFATVACGKLGFVAAGNKSPRLVVDSSILGVTGACIIPNRLMLPAVTGVLACAPPTCPTADWTAISLDIRKAHRRIKIAPCDQALLTFSFEGKYYTCNTLNFGARASSFWWGRVSGALMRLTHQIVFLSHLLWHYVDDFLGAFPAKTAPLHGSLWVILFLVLNVPMSWSKCCWGPLVRWIGWDICVGSWMIFLPSEKTDKLLQTLKSFLKQHRIRARELESLIGKLLWLTNLWHCFRPLLCPLYAALARLPQSCAAVSPELWGQLLKACDDSLILLRGLSHKSFSKGCQIRRVANSEVRELNDLAAVRFRRRRLWVTVQDPRSPLRSLDAGAHDALRAWQDILLGSPLCYPLRSACNISITAEADAFAETSVCGLGGFVRLTNGELRWFSITLSAAQATDIVPELTEPLQSHIAALEMLAQLLLLWSIHQMFPGPRLRISVTLRCDNASAEAAALKGMSPVKALCAVLRSFMWHQRAWGIDAHVDSRLRQ